MKSPKMSNAPDVAEKTAMAKKMNAVLGVASVTSAVGPTILLLSVKLRLKPMRTKRRRNRRSRR